MKLKLGKSAVIFTSVFLLLGCEPREVAPAKNTEKSQAASAQIEPSRTQLTRGIYEALVFAPHQVQNEAQAQVIQDLFEGLTAYDPAGNIVPAVAENWQTKDNQTWRFVLREGARWSNGELITAQDFVASWYALAQSVSPLKSYLTFMNVQNAAAVLAGEMNVEQLGFKAENDRTLQIQLDKPTPYLPAMLAHIALLPQYPHSAENLVSNGAYQLESAGENQAVLTANDNYWAKDKVSFKRVVYQKLQGDSPFTQADIVFNPPQSSPNVQHFPSLCSYFYEFNLADPTLQNAAVRKAIVSLVSVKNVVGNLADAMPSNAFLPKSFNEEQESLWEPVVAEQLLAQNGVSETKPLRLTLSYDENPMHTGIAEQLNRQLSQSDLLRVTNQPMSWQALQEKRAKGDFQLIRSGWCADFNDPAAFLNLFYSHSPDNKNGYRNAEFDRQFEMALKTTDEKVRSEIYTKLAQRIQQENLVLPIFQYSQSVYLAPTLMGAGKSTVGGLKSQVLWRRVENK